jgi:hypothetical protein
MFRYGTGRRVWSQQPQEPCQMAARKTAVRIPVGSLFRPVAAGSNAYGRRPRRPVGGRGCGQIGGRLRCKTQPIPLTVERLCHSLTPGCHDSSSASAGAFRASWNSSRNQEAEERENGHAAFRNSHAPAFRGGHGVALVGLKSDGSVDSGRNFLFTHRPTRGAQKSYATQLANMLGCKVIEVSE